MEFLTQDVEDLDLSVPKIRFDTCNVIKVRRAITFDEHVDALNVDHNFVKEWRVLRKSFLEEIKKKEINHNKILEIFESIWCSLSKLRIDHTLYLPPLYQKNIMLTNLLQRFVGEIVSRENGSMLQSGNIILNGVQGTGKTTLLKAMVIVVAICCEKFFFIYHNFKEGLFTSDQLIKECVYRFQNGKCDGKFGDIAKTYQRDLSVSLEPLAKLNIYVGIAADEVQQVIVVDKDLDWRINIMKSLENFARTEMNHVFLILSGSAANLARLLFRSMRPKNLVDFDFDLNASLCDRYYVAANRNKSSLESYLKDRYPTHVFDSSEICKILMKTGGIGRFVHNYMQNFAVDGYNPTTGRKANPRALYADPSTFYLIIANLIMAKNSVIFSSLKNNSYNELTHCPGVPLNDVIDLLNQIGKYDSVAIVNNLVDLGVLYVSQDGPLDSFYKVEFAVPLDWVLIENNKNNEISLDDYTLFAASFLMIYAGIENNAGKAFERFVRCRLYHLNSNFHYYGRFLRIIDKKLYIGEYEDAIYSKECISLVKEIDLNSFVYEAELFVWEGEIGLDGVCIRVERVNNDDVDQSKKKKTKIPNVFISGWQCKGGHWENSVGGGAIKTSRDSYITSGNVENIVDRQVNGILTKAEVGLLTIMNALCNTIDKCDVSIGHVMINTTKDATVGRKSLEKTYIIPKTMTSKFPLIRKNRQDRSQFSYTVIFYDKDQWFRVVLKNDKRLLELLPVPVAADTDKSFRCLIS